MKNIYFYDTLIGKVGIADNGEAVTDLIYVDGMPQGADAVMPQGTTGNSHVTSAGNPLDVAGAASGLKDWVSELYGANLNESPLIREAARQLNEFLSGKRKAFDLPLEPEGTPFQKEVWKALTGIPYGETRTYRDIAENIGRPKACRAVGMANNKNPIAIVIPCHRVIGADGKLVGYAGGLDVKKKLLDLEKSPHSRV